MLYTYLFCYPLQMERPGRIMRRSIHKFFQNYHYFVFSAASLALPFAASVLLYQAVAPSAPPPLPTILSRLQTLYEAAGFPPSSQFFSLLNIKLSQTICLSIFTLPFALSFLLLAKAAIVQALRQDKTLPSPSFTSSLPLYIPLLQTYICNSFIILSANASVLFLFFLVFNFLDASGFSSPNFQLFLSASGAVLYSVILAMTFITCNLALVVAGMENCGGYIAILKACVLIRGRAFTALFLTLPVNFSLAALEALFHYRLMRAYHLSHTFTFPRALEGLLIAYIYSLVILMDGITTCMLYKSCKSRSLVDGEGGHYRIEIMEEKYLGNTNNCKILHELP